MKKQIKIKLNKFSAIILFAVATLSFIYTPVDVSATHFRYGNISWTWVSGRQVTFHVTQSWRRSYPWTPAYPNVGNVVNTGTLNFGDGSATINLTVTSVNLTEDLFVGEADITHTYSGTATSFTAFFENCCRLSAPPSGLLMNNGDKNYRVQTVVNLQAGAPHNNSPVASIPPIVYVQTGLAGAAFQIATSDPDIGQTFNCLLATPAQMGIGTSHPSGLTVSPSGLVTFNTIGKTVGTFWSTQIVVSDNLGASTAVDFLIKIINQSNPPYFNYFITPSNNTTFEIQPGNPLCFSINAADNDGGDMVTLSSTGLPAGASLTPALPATGNPVQTQFCWTPTLAQLGSRVINFTAQDLNGTQTTTSVNVIVSTNPVFDVPQSPAMGDQLCVECNNNYCVSVQAHAPDPLVNVQITSANVPPGCIITPGIPSVSGNTSAIQLCWNANPSDFGPHSVNFTATDALGHSQNHSFTLIPNTTPAFTSTPGNLNITENQPFNYDITTIDPDEPYGDFVELLAVNLPTWLLLVDHTDGTALLSGTPTIADVGINHVRIDVEDIYHHCHAEVSQEFDIIVTPCNFTVSLTPVPAPVAGIYCPGTPVSLRASTANSYLWNTFATTSAINVVAGTSSFYFVTATQGFCTATASYIITGIDNQNPTINCPSNIIVNNPPNNCGATVNYNITASDNCSAVVINKTTGMASGAYFPLGTTTNTFVVTDESNNTSTCSFTVTVNAANSTTPAQPGIISGPSAVCKGSNVTYSIATVPGATNYTWTAVSGATISIGQGSTSVVVNFSNTAANASLSVIASNPCGSSIARTLAYAVSSTLPTQPVTISGPLTGTCNQTGVAYSCPVVSNAFSYQWTVPAGVNILTGQGTNAITVKFTGSFLNSGIISVIAKNGCGNSASQSRTVSAVPQSPVISGLNYACKDQQGVVYSVTPITGVTSYTWTVVAGSTIASGQGTTSIVVNWGANNGVITCKTNNLCGSSLPASKAVSFTCKEAGGIYTFSEMNLYPNPATLTTTLQFEGFEESSAQLMIFNLTGQQLFYKKLAVKTGINQYSLELNLLPKGIYLIKVKCNDLERNTRLVVQ